MGRRGRGTGGGTQPWARGTEAAASGLWRRGTGDGMPGLGRGSRGAEPPVCGAVGKPGRRGWSPVGLAGEGPGLGWVG